MHGCAKRPPNRAAFSDERCVHDPSNGRREILDRVARNRIHLVLVSRTVLAGADQKGAADARRERAGDVGFGIVADHDRLLAVAPGAGERGLEEIGSRLAEQDRFTLTGIFQRGHEGACVEAELAVIILEAAVARERQEFSAVQQFAKRSVQRGVGEALGGVADHDGFTRRAVELGKILRKIRMDQEVRRKSPGGKPRSRGLSRREELLVGNRDAHFVQTRQKRASRHARRVGEKTQAQARLAQTRDGIDGARQRLFALINDAGKIEQNCAYHRARMSSAPAGSIASRDPITHARASSPDRNAGSARCAPAAASAGRRACRPRPPCRARHG